ncbi:hypothetical protein CEXT_612971 [Caerostris extrusa]|uniref:Uncharacterized protein n=1 Tax=Caerostris extrusa TaxID=172846 RepID=A0AAV4V204_CAEEX|nr:hypothetical protein CEXT_612971 [Caerostris extrusa]
MALLSPYFAIVLLRHCPNRSLRFTHQLRGKTRFTSFRSSVIGSLLMGVLYRWNPQVQLHRQLIKGVCTRIGEELSNCDCIHNTLTLSSCSSAVTREKFISLRFSSPKISALCLCAVGLDLEMTRYQVVLERMNFRNSFTNRRSRPAASAVAKCREIGPTLR